MPLTRVSAVQFAVTSDVAANLATCLRMINEAAHYQPALIVLPEFCNHILWFRDNAHCYETAVALDSEFLQAIGAKAREHHCYIKINCTVQRAAGKVTGTNILFNPQGAPVAVNDKQILMGNENNFLERATAPAPLTATSFGQLGMYCCMDGVIPEPARSLAVRGAHILLNSLNSFAFDEAALHIPTRAGENKTYVVAANKVGLLVPPEQAAIVAARMKISADFLHGAGESQILAPDGTVLAKAPRTGEAVIYADIDVALAKDKRRPDGTDVMTMRRPALYRALAEPPRPRATPPGAPRLETATYQPRATGLEAVEEVAEVIATSSAQLLVLPELFHLTEDVVTAPNAGAAASARMVETLRAALAARAGYVATTLVAPTAEGRYQHVGVLIGSEGIVVRQPQLHHAGRHGWVTALGDALNFFDAPWGRVALVVGGDAIYPEVFRLAALQDVDVVAVPTRILETWELQTGLLERACENRLNLVVASHAASAIIALDKDFTLWAQWERPFDGKISYPIVTRAAEAFGLTTALVFPAAAANRMISQKTNVVEGRPWNLLEGLVQ